METQDLERLTVWLDWAYAQVKPSKRPVTGRSRTVLLATQRAFAKEAVDRIEMVTTAAQYELRKLENYKSKDELLAAVKDVDALIVGSDVVDGSVLNAADNLKIVVNAGTGYDNIDLMAVQAKKVVAMSTPVQNNAGVAAASQIVNFFEKGDARFQKHASKM